MNFAVLDKKGIVKMIIQLSLLILLIDDRDTIVEQGFVPTTDPNGWFRSIYVANLSWQMWKDTLTAAERGSDSCGIDTMTDAE